MKPVIAISMGDPAGIGAEITVKALQGRGISEKCVPVVVGDSAAIRDAIRFCRLDLKVEEIEEPAEARDEDSVINLIDLKLLSPGGWEYKKAAAHTGEASFRYVVKSIELAMSGKADAVVTGPISKEAINMAGHHYSGHTEIFAGYTGTGSYGMLLSGGGLRVIHVTTHMSLEEACRTISQQRVYRAIRLAEYSMKLLGIEHPRVGVAGLNPHASENGLFGTQERESIIPAVEQAAAEGIEVSGPVPPDTVFVKALGGQFDIVVAMYHDQGHIPIKLCGFRMDPETGKYTSMSGINCTIGLPFIRSSVDHGTAYGKAGEGRANPDSMVEAIEAAVIMSGNMKRTKKPDF